MHKDDGSNPWSVKWASTVLNYDGQISGSSNLASQTPTAAIEDSDHLCIGVFKQ